MRKKSKSNAGKRFKAAVLTAAASAVIAVSSAPAAFAAENLALAAQVEVGDEPVEHESPITQEASVIFDLNPYARTTTVVTVPKGSRAETGGFTAKGGQLIGISAIGTPSSVSYKIGYCNSSTQHYCDAQGSLEHTFTVAKTGDYRIFIENNSSTTDLQITISYGVMFP